MATTACGRRMSMAKKREPDKLSQEVSQAIAAGMSYGNWKAMQVPVEIPQKPPKECFTVSICEHCGCEYGSYCNRSRKYCGERCRRAAHDKRTWQRRSERGKAENVWVE